MPTRVAEPAAAPPETPLSATPARQQIVSMSTFAPTEQQELDTTRRRSRMTPGKVFLETVCDQDARRRRWPLIIIPTEAAPRKSANCGSQTHSITSSSGYESDRRLGCPNVDSGRVSSSHGGGEMKKLLNERPFSSPVAGRSDSTLARGTCS